MQFKRAHISNFKLLEDLDVDFSRDRTRPLTIVRAENASGKTSLLTALQWGLYGEEALEDRWVPLSSSHVPAGTPTDISVDIRFSHTEVTEVAGVQDVTARDYRLRRAVTEVVVDGRPQRKDETVTLMEIKSQGAEQIDPPQQYLERLMSRDLRDIFFTNGDAAMNFISPQLTRANKRTQVQNAIKALLEIGVVEDAIGHVDRVARAKRRESGEAASGADVARLASEAENLDTRIKGLELQRRKLEEEVRELGTHYETADRELQEALQRGNQEELARRLGEVRERKVSASVELANLRREHQRLFGRESLSWALLEEHIRAGTDILHDLHDSGVIPKAALPVLRDRLNLGICICGASLAPGSPARAAVEQELARQASADVMQQRLTRLYHQAEAELTERAASRGAWTAELRRVMESRSKWNKVRRDASAEEEVLEAQIAAIGKTDIEEKRQARKALESALAQKREDVQRIDMELLQLRPQKELADEAHAQALKKDNKLQRYSAQITAAQHILDVLRGVLTELQTDYLTRVSTRMDDLFKQMIGVGANLEEEDAAAADDVRGITGASITPEFDIVVHAGSRTLNPDHELNGASQRALTFAFIWALTEVSDTVAPRAIDTPLGMMSGYVKRSVLDLISSPAGEAGPDRQVILFLTRSEIAQVENILDKRAGVIFTMTNTAAGDLTCRQPGDYARVIRCECNHRQYCQVCSRFDDAAYNLVPRA